MADNNNIITSDVDTSEQAVSEIRKEVMGGVEANHSDLPEDVPADRIAIKQNLVNMVASGILTAKIASTDRCIRVVNIPVKGGKTIECHCSKACVQVGNQYLCPEHDKAAFQPQQTPHGTKPRVTNSASIPLTKSELKELGLKEDVVHVSPPTTAASVPGQPAPASTGVTRAEVRISFSLEELSSKDLLSLFQNRVCEALDGLTCANLRQMKQMVAIQEKIAKMGKQRKLRVLKGQEEDNGR